VERGAGATRQRTAANDEKAGGADEATPLCVRTDPEERTLDVAVGWNKPTRRRAAQAVEGVRNAEGGKVAGVEPRRKDALR
jgi:hypothetical protein